MSTLATEPIPVPKQRKPADDIRDRIDLRADPEWVARVAAQAERLGLNVSAYIRQAVTRQLERDEAEAPVK